MSRDTLTCDEHVGGETLSAWRDALLPDDEMRRVEAHTASCPACRQTLDEFEDVARALHRQVELEPDARILAEVLLRAEARRRLRWLRLPRVRLWSGLGALGSVAALLLLFVYVFNTLPGPHPPRPAGTAPVAYTASVFADTSVATAIPSATVAPTAFSPIVSAQTAWGAPTSTKALTIQADATHVFLGSGVMPDGRTLFGNMLPVTSDGQLAQTASAQTGLFDSVTRKFTAIGLSSLSEQPANCCMTDGRFVIASDYTEPGATCGVCHIRYWSYDSEAGTLWKVAVGSQFESIIGADVSHGLLVFSTFEGIQVANLVTHTIAPLAGAPASSSEPILAFSWPYLVYSIAQTNSASTRIRNMQTGQERTISVPGPVGPMAIAADALFSSVTSSDNSETTVYEMDHFDVSGARWNAIGRYPGDIGPPKAANSRIVVLSTAVWDRAERRFVTYGPPTNPGALFSLDGTFLVAQIPASPVDNLTAGQVALYDTTTLPVRSGA